MRSLPSSLLLSASLLGTVATARIVQGMPMSFHPVRESDPSIGEIMEALGKQGIRIHSAEAQSI